MFMELLKLRNKLIDISSVRVKYKIDEDEETTPKHVQYFEEQSIEQPVEHDWNETPVALPQPEPLEINPVIKPSPTMPNKTERPALRSPRKLVREEPVPSPAGVKLLNPTIHVKIRTISRLELFKCDLCSHTSSTKASITRHMTQIHLSNSTNSFKCEVCFKRFAKKVILQNHAKIHMTQRPTFDCHYCGKVLSNRTAVASHIKWLHEEKREFRCSACSKMFATVS